MKVSKWEKETELEHIDRMEEKSGPNQCKYQYMANLLMSKWRDFAFEIESSSPSFSALDVGGGPLGGALPLCKLAISTMKSGVLLDPLVDEYREIPDCPKLPDYIQPIKGFSDDIPFEDNKFDVVFNWECLDHCDNLDIFKKSIKESIRVLKKDGMIFFEMPIRDKLVAGHPIHTGIISVEEIIGLFEQEGLYCHKKEMAPNTYGSPRPLMIIGSKSG